MDEVLNFMIKREWEDDSKEERKLYLHRLAQDGMRQKEITDKIGSMLIYNQIIEQLLKEVLVASVAYIKAEIWPSSVLFDLDLDKATFGKQIEFFRRFAIKEYNREIILDYLNRMKKQRNEVVHKLFSIDDLDLLGEQLIAFGDLATETMMLLLEYYNQICWRLYDLYERVDFSELVE